MWDKDDRPTQEGFYRSDHNSCETTTFITFVYFFQNCEVTSDVGVVKVFKYCEASFENLRRFAYFMQELLRTYHDVAELLFQDSETLGGGHSLFNLLALWRQGTEKG